MRASPAHHPSGCLSTTALVVAYPTRLDSLDPGGPEIRGLGKLGRIHAPPPHVHARVTTMPSTCNGILGLDAVGAAWLGLGSGSQGQVHGEGQGQGQGQGQ